MTFFEVILSWFKNSADSTISTNSAYSVWSKIPVLDHVLFFKKLLSQIFHRVLHTSLVTVTSHCLKFCQVSVEVLQPLPKSPDSSQRLIYPVDTGRKLNVHKTFRKRPERLLNVLCTFNLRPVSTGQNPVKHLRRSIWKEIRNFKVSMRPIPLPSYLGYEHKNA